MSVAANGDERLFGSLVLGHVVPENQRRIYRGLKYAVVTGGTPVGRGVERRKALRVIPATTLCERALIATPLPGVCALADILSTNCGVGRSWTTALPSMSGIWGHSENIYSQ